MRDIIKRFQKYAQSFLSPQEDAANEELERAKNAQKAREQKVKEIIKHPDWEKRYHYLLKQHSNTPKAQQIIIKEWNQALQHQQAKEFSPQPNSNRLESPADPKIGPEVEKKQHELLQQQEKAKTPPRLENRKEMVGPRKELVGPKQPTEPKTPAKPKIHTVQKGESLSLIAKKYYNDIHKWKVIFEANKNTMKSKGNPNLIYPGEKFIIPEIK